MHCNAFTLTVCVIMLCMMRSLSAETTTTPLAACPKSPNCVSSQAPATDSKHYIAPIRFSGSPVMAWQRLKTALLAEKRITIVAEGDDYLHAEARSLVFRFVDDIEFSLQADAGLIDIRSAARTGYSDFGVNRRRMEHLRSVFNSEPAR